jgi:REP element-mobilizing transposase RayT
MPRDVRPRVHDCSYHVTWRGVRRSRIFVDDLDAARFVEMLATVVRQQEWECQAYCLMPNHVHLLVRTPHCNLPEGMQQLGTRYAMRFNRRHGFAGHVFERRYWATVVGRDEHLLELVRYIALNPVRAGLCEQPDEWRWSSFAATVSALRRLDVASIASARSVYGGGAALSGFSPA